MAGFNLPPGCSVSDIPGNTPEDEAGEAMYESICEGLEIGKLVDPLTVDEEWYDKLVMFIMTKMGEAYGLGYRAGVNDEGTHHEIKAAEKLAKEAGF